MTRGSQTLPNPRSEYVSLPDNDFARLKFRIQAAIVRAVLRMANLILRVLTRILFRRPRRARLDTVRRIAIYRVGNIGDILVALPALQAIRGRFPQAYIVFITSAGSANSIGARELLPTGIWYDELFRYDQSDLSNWRGLLGLVRRARALNCQLFVELSNVLSTLATEVKTIAFANVIGSSYLVGTRVSELRWFRRAQSLHLPSQNERDRLMSFIEEDLELNRPGPVFLAAVGEDWVDVENALSTSLVPRSYIVIHPGCKHPLNQWPESRFAEVAKFITGQGLTVVLTGSKAESAICANVARDCEGHIADASGLLSVSQLVLLLRNALLYIGNDTGPMHIASAVGTPSISIFSARDYPFQWFPAGENDIILRRDVPCSPCLAEVCPYGMKCLDLIQVDDVVRALDQQMQRLTMRAPALLGDSGWNGGTRG
ncbi:MAG: glycosyltransferase family 9 protein [Bryobacteraceae bacterium]